MNYNDSYIGDKGRKCIISWHKEVFEEIPSPDKNHQNMEYGQFDQYCSEDEYTCQCGEKNKIRMIEVDKVLGTGSGNTIVEVCIPLCPPAVEVISCLATENIFFDVMIARKGKVFINGRLLKNIPYKTSFKPVCCPGGLTGSSKCAIAEVPFVICIDVPGAVEGAKVVVLDYDVNSINLPNCDCGCKIKSITEKDCISVKVKAIKPVTIPIPHECCNGCR